MKGYFLCALLCCTTMFCNAQTPRKDSSANKTTFKKWYDNISIRGYVQVRYNRLLETNKNLKCEQCDRSIGDNGGIFLRRTRIIFSGQLNDNVFFYVQPDFASSVGTTQNIVQIRDAYFDFSLDKKKEYRFRVGQSKIPYGFENMQSSQNRLPLDRNDALNSPLSNERDLGAFFYWAPEKTRKQYAHFVNDGLKGSGDYGVVAFGVFNGQTANRLEQNNGLHVVGRVSYPITIGKQIIEPGIQGYTGKVVVTSDSRTAGVKSANNFSFDDKRVATSFILYPQPFGIQAEYNWGTGPEYVPTSDSIINKNLKGGYATITYLLKNKKGMVFMPFSRYQQYEGGKKHELDARSYSVKELETGLEWQINKNFELTASYVIANRRFEDKVKPSNTQKGNFLRIQAQLNF
jgi:phosphate-selective porin